MQFIDYSESGSAVLFNYTFGQAHQIVAPCESRALCNDFACYMFVNGAASVEQRESVSQRSVGNFCYQSGGVLVESDILMLGDILESRADILGCYSLEVKSLATRKNSRGELVYFCSSEDKYNMLRRLFENFQKSVERAGREHMHLVYNIDSVLRFNRRKVCLVSKIANIVNAVI